MAKSQTAYNRKWYKDNKDKAKASSRKHYENNKEAQRTRMKELYQKNKIDWIAKSENARLLRSYGISREEYNKMLAEQNEVCAICKQKDNKRLAVDHCHKTGKVRGLLCAKHNRALGAFNDDPSLLEAAIKYLKSVKKRI